jgi:hypothetical protein
MDTQVLDLSHDQQAHAAVLEATVTLTEPQVRLRVRLPPGDPGRAEAVFDKRSWAAKHYWQEELGVTIYEFDEPLPPGPVTVRIPFARSKSP